jgi:hypothetical protein
MKLFFPICFLCTIFLMNCHEKKNFGIAIDKRDASPRDTMDKWFGHPYSIISFIYFENGKYKVFVNNKLHGKGELEQNSSGESGGYECKNIKQNDTIKIEVDNYNPFQFLYDEHYANIYLWYSGKDSIRIEYSNRQYDFE